MAAGSSASSSHRPARAWQPAAAYVGSSVLFLVSVFCLFLIGPVPRPGIDRNRHPLRQMIDGLAYVRGNRLVLGAITLDLSAVFLAGATALLPIFARDILQVGAEGLGKLAAAPAAGAILSALYFSWRPLKTDVGAKMLGAVALFGAATVVFGLSRSFPLSLAALFVAGLTALGTLLLTAAPFAAVAGSRGGDALRPGTRGAIGDRWGNGSGQCNEHVSSSPTAGHQVIPPVFAAA